MNADKVGVHATHCCPIYGCKYGNKDCPVELKQIEPVYPCEDCDCAKFNPEMVSLADAWWTTLSDDIKTSIYMSNLHF